VKYEKRLGKTLVFGIFLSEGFKYSWNCDIWRYFSYFGCVAQSLGECLSRWATVYFSDMHSFSKIDFPDSLTVGLSSNFDIWFITCYFMVWPVGSSIICLYLEKCVTHYCNDFGFVIINFLRNIGVRIMVVGCAWLYGIVGT